VRDGDDEEEKEKEKEEEEEEKEDEKSSQPTELKITPDDCSSVIQLQLIPGESFPVASNELVWNDVFPNNIMCPSDGNKTSTAFMADLKSQLNRLKSSFLMKAAVEDLAADLIEGKSANKRTKADIAQMKKEFKQAQTISTKHVPAKIVYVKIEYPVITPACFKWTLSESPTYPLLLWIHARSYALMYAIEHAEVGDPGLIPGMFNRAPSSGQFEIWGHGIGDLIYNGNSHIVAGTKADGEAFVICDFSVDS